VPDAEILELDAAAPGTELLPRTFRDLHIIDDLALHALHVDKPPVAPEDLQPGGSLAGRLGGQVADAQPSHADVNDLAKIDQLARSQESSKRAFLPAESLVSSLLHRHR